MKFLIIFDCFGNRYWYDDPIYAVFGFILIIIIIVLTIREKMRKPIIVEQNNVSDQTENLYIEKDVLGLDKVSFNHNGPNYGIADKTKLKYAVYVFLLLIALLLILKNAPEKVGPAGSIIHPSYYDLDGNLIYGDEFKQGE